MKQILFSPPDITQAEIDEVVDTLKSGWITTGPKTKLFESQIVLSYFKGCMLKFSYSRYGTYFKDVRNR